MSSKEIRLTMNISGFDNKDGYEKACQDMLAAGERWLKGKQRSIWGKDAAYGLKEKYLEGKEGLRNVLCKVTDPTGAQAGAVISHLRYIHLNGRKRWIREG